MIPFPNALLDRMATSSHERMEAARRIHPEDELRARVGDLRPLPPLRMSRDGFDIIAEVKRRSPSAGSLEGEAPAGGEPSGNAITDRVHAYVAGGAAAISVLTEPTEFNGSLADLERASAASLVPTVRKDFLVDPYQVLEARAHGASGVLLIVRMLSDHQLQDLLGTCASLGMFALVETFDVEDLERAERRLRQAPVSPWFPGLAGPSLGVPGYTACLVGINARDLTTLEVNTARFAELVRHFPPGFPRVAESGLETPDDAARVASLGYRVGLVGSALMRSADPQALIRDMLGAARGARSNQRSAG